MGRPATTGSSSAGPVAPGFDERKIKTSDAHWKRMKTDFDERKIIDTDYAMMHMNRHQKAMPTLLAPLMIDALLQKLKGCEK
jgi:hypothetical protein